MNKRIVLPFVVLVSVFSISVLCGEFRLPADYPIGKLPEPFVVRSWTAPEPPYGKQAGDVLREGPPPKRSGPGLRFDTSALFYVYSDYRASANRFIPSGWIGDYADIVLNDHSVDDPAVGRTCVKITYLPRGTNGADWAGMFWLDKPNNWGNRPEGFPLAGMKRLTFWARGEHGGERINVFQAGGIQGRYPDTGMAQIGPIDLTKEWTQYVIDLEGLNLNKVSGGFAWSVDRFANAEAITFYLDDIRYERDSLVQTVQKP